MKKRFILIILAAILIGGLVFSSRTKTALDTTPPSKAPFSVHAESIADRQSTTFEASYPGTISSEGEANLVAHVSGTIVTAKLAVNQPVALGQVLFVINETGTSLASIHGLESSDLQTAFLTLQNAKRAYQEAVHQDNQKKSATSENAKIEAKNNRDIAQIAYTTLLDQRVVKSPINGTVTLKNVSVGDSVTSGTPLATLSRGKKTVRFYVSDTERLLLSAGQDISFTKDTGKTNLLTGKILRVSQTADAGSRRFLAEAESSDPNFKDFSPGAIVTVFTTISRQAKTGHFFLPLSAVLREQTGSAVFTVTDGKATRAAVDIQDIDGEVVELSGLTDPATIVITSNVKRLTDGDTLTLE